MTPLWFAMACQVSRKSWKAESTTKMSVKTCKVGISQLRKATQLSIEIPGRRIGQRVFDFLHFSVHTPQHIHTCIWHIAPAQVHLHIRAFCKWPRSRFVSTAASFSPTCNFSTCHLRNAFNIGYRMTTAGPPTSFSPAAPSAARRARSNVNVTSRRPVTEECQSPRAGDLHFGKKHGGPKTQV